MKNQIKYFCVFLAMTWLVLIACQNKKTLEYKLTDTNKSQFWKILKWNLEDYSNDTLLIKFYENNEYEMFRINKKKSWLVSLKPGPSSDITSDEFWEIRHDTILLLKKRMEFKLLYQKGDTINFISPPNLKDSLSISKFTLDLNKIELKK